MGDVETLRVTLGISRHQQIKSGRTPLNLAINPLDPPLLLRRIFDLGGMTINAEGLRPSARPWGPCRVIPAQAGIQKPAQKEVLSQGLTEGRLGWALRLGLWDRGLSRLRFHQMRLSVG